MCGRPGEGESAENRGGVKKAPRNTIRGLGTSLGKH